MKYEIRENEDGKFWFLNGKYHREDGPACEWSDGDKHWYLNGKLHREDGPAIEHVSGDKEWWLNGKLHREGGPAVEWVGGYKSYYLSDIFYTEKEYLEKARCKYCGGKYRSMKAINEIIYYCPRCQR